MGTHCNCLCDESIMNGPHASSMMNEKNDYDSSLSTSATTNYAKTFVASTPMPCVNVISSRRLQNNNDQWGCATIVHMMNRL